MFSNLTYALLTNFPESPSQFRNEASLSFSLPLLSNTSRHFLGECRALDTCRGIITSRRSPANIADVKDDMTALMQHNSY